MKHLGVLSRAGLLRVERRGRERWNALDPLPIRRIHRRWIRPFEERGADWLLGLRGFAEREGGGVAGGDDAYRIEEVRLEVSIAAPPARVWAGLTRDAGRWWPREFHSRKDTKRFVVEAEVGGRVYEDAGDGEGLVWYRVIGVQAPRRLLLSGDLFPDYGGPAGLQTTFALEPEGRGTRVRFEEIVHGRVGEKTRKSLDEGWRLLLEGTLKPWLEFRKR
jgi:uncharacterized protein YndB with AHSA1/START domain